MRIEEAAAIKQAMIDSGNEKIIGLNYYKNEEETSLELLEIDNTTVRNNQIASINKIRSTRNNDKVQAALEHLTLTARSGGNLLEASVSAARSRATLGEISAALEAVFGRHKAETKMISGVYMRNIGDDISFSKAKELSGLFAAKEGRRPRILVGKLGQDGHDRGAKVIATSFADLGFDVDIGPLFQTPEEVAMQAAENDVHIVGISSLAAGHKTLVPAVIAELDKLGRSDILVVAGGVIPPKDYDFLYKAGVKAVFGPGTVIPEAAIELLNILLETLHPKTK